MEKNYKNNAENKIRKKQFINSSSRLFRLISGCFCILLLFCLSACGHTAGKSKLMSYAEETYGKCKLISEEHSGSGSDEIRTIYLHDLDTGLEYSVTSQMIAINIDGSVFGYSEQKSSDFDEKYKKYVFDLAEQELSELNTGYPAQVTLSDSLSTNKVIFDSRTSDDDSKIVCRKIAGIIASHDTKNYLLIDFLVYSENKEICIGYYDYLSDTFESYEPYTVIDYVYENIDKDAEYLFSLGGTLDAYLSYEDLQEVDPDNTKSSTNGIFYFFLSSTGVEFVAFNMEDYGMPGIRCVTTDSREKFTLSPD